MRRAIAIVLAALAACGPSGGSVRHIPIPDLVGSASSYRSFTVLTRAELLASAQNRSAYDAVLRLRPELVRAGKPSGGSLRGRLPVVYVDDVLQGGLDVLHTISASRVREIRRLSETEAFAHYGPRYPGGVLVVTLVY